MEGPSWGRARAEPVLEAGAALARVSRAGGQDSGARPWGPEGAGEDGTFPGDGETSPNAEQRAGEESSVLCCCLSLGTFPAVLTPKARSQSVAAGRGRDPLVDKVLEAKCQECSMLLHVNLSFLRLKSELSWKPLRACLHTGTSMVC